jgi:hypothetical protein
MSLYETAVEQTVLGPVLPFKVNMGGSPFGGQTISSIFKRACSRIYSRTMIAFNSKIRTIFYEHLIIL